MLNPYLDIVKALVESNQRFWTEFSANIEEAQKRWSTELASLTTIEVTVPKFMVPDLTEWRFEMPSGGWVLPAEFYKAGRP